MEHSDEDESPADEFSLPNEVDFLCLKKIATRSGFPFVARPFVLYFKLAMILLSTFLQRQFFKWKLT
jgi:hypothetical protein